MTGHWARIRSTDLYRCPTGRSRMARDFPAAARSCAGRVGLGRATGSGSRAAAASASRASARRRTSPFPAGPVPIRLPQVKMLAAAELAGAHRAADVGVVARAFVCDGSVTRAARGLMPRRNSSGVSTEVVPGSSAVARAFWRLAAAALLRSGSRGQAGLRGRRTGGCRRRQIERRRDHQRRALAIVDAGPADVDAHARRGCS